MGMDHVVADNRTRTNSTRNGRSSLLAGNGPGQPALNHSLLDLTDSAVGISHTVTVISRDGENNLYEFATAAGWRTV